MTIAAIKNDDGLYTLNFVDTLKDANGNDVPNVVVSTQVVKLDQLNNDLFNAQNIVEEINAKIQACQQADANVSVAKQVSEESQQSPS